MSRPVVFSIVGIALALVTGLRAQAPPGSPPVPIGPRPNAGPPDRPPVDAAAADRGRSLYGSECITCHGASARGTSTGPSLIRSAIVLNDRYGSTLGPFFKKGHQMQSGGSSTVLSSV